MECRTGDTEQVVQDNGVQDRGVQGNGVQGNGVQDRGVQGHGVQDWGCREGSCRGQNGGTRFVCGGVYDLGGSVSDAGKCV